MSEVATKGVSNLGGPYAPSRDAGAVMKAGRQAMADLYGCSTREVVFGPNMTTLTFAASRALARHFGPGGEIVVTGLDHDGNVTPWVLAAEESGLEVRVLEASDYRLDPEALRHLLSERTRLVAFTAASNAVGTVTDVKALADVVRDAGALSYVDAVHYTPHGVVDVVSWGVDFLVASAYKWFGPHAGILYGREALLEEIKPFKLRASWDEIPWSWETGTQNFAVIAGITAAVDYLAGLGHGDSRREQLLSAYDRIVEHETALSERFLAGMAEIAGTTLHGLETAEARTPTFAVEVERVDSSAVATALASSGVFVSHGNYYALDIMEKLGFRQDGLARFGFAHYHTTEEVDRTLRALEEVAG